jgi:hypothetical protein
MKFKRGDAVEISWVDSCSMQGGWKSHDDIEDFGKDRGRYRTVGIVWGVRRKRLIVVQSTSHYKDARGNACEVFAIPLVAIVKWRVLY